MYSLLAAANEESSSTAARGEPPEVAFDRSGGNTITRGCYLAGTTPGAIALGGLSTGAGAAPAVAYAEEGAGARQALLGIDKISRKRAHPGPGVGLIGTGPQRNRVKGLPQRDSASRERIEAISQDKHPQRQQKPFREFRIAGSNAAPEFFNNNVSSPDITDTDEGCSALLQPSDETRFGGFEFTATTNSPWSPVGDFRRTDVAFPVPAGAMPEYSEGEPAEPTGPELVGPLSVTCDNGINPTVSSFSFRTPGPSSFLASNNLRKEDSASRAPAARHKQASCKSRGSLATRKEQHRHQGKNTATTTNSDRLLKPHQRSGKKKTAHSSPSLSRRLDGIFSAYSNHTDGAPTVSSANTAATEKGPTAEQKIRGGKCASGGGGGGDGKKKSSTRTRAGAQVVHDATGGDGSTAGWTHGGNTAAAVAAARAAERTRQLEALMNAAMESPVTYEEQIRRERLVHLRMMYTVSWVAIMKVV